MSSHSHRCSLDDALVGQGRATPAKSHGTKAMALGAKVIRLGLLIKSRSLFSSKCRGFGILAVSESGPRSKEERASSIVHVAN